MSAWVRILLIASEAATHCSSLQTAGSPGHRSPSAASKHLRHQLFREKAWLGVVAKVSNPRASEGGRQSSGPSHAPCVLGLCCSSSQWYMAEKSCSVTVWRLERARGSSHIVPCVRLRLESLFWLFVIFSSHEWTWVRLSLESEHLLCQILQCHDQDVWLFFSDLVLPCPVISGLGQAPLVTWNRDQEPDVVQELLQDSSDKAYGKKGVVCGRVALPRDWLI